jgi:hypothetical protein
MFHAQCKLLQRVRLYKCMKLDIFNVAWHFVCVCVCEVGGGEYRVCV